MTLETVTETDVGRLRGHNEDSVCTGAYGEYTLLAVADGMGGHAAGDVASEAALDALRASLDDSLPDSRPDEVLGAGATAANEYIDELIAENPDYEGMGTTLVAALVRGGDVTVCNVGDSRAYHVTDDAIEQVTVDQSVVQELIEKGELDPERADTHPRRHMLSQALGSTDLVEPDFYDLELTGTLLLCSDGLTEEVPDSSIHEVVTGGDALDEVADDLCALANENGGKDNVTVALARGA